MMVDADPADPGLLERIYDAALDPALWPSFLQALASTYPGGQGVLYTVGPRNGRVVLANWDPAWTAAYNSHFDRVNPWLPRMWARPAGVVNAAEQMMPMREFRRTEYFNDFLRPQGIGTGVGATISRTNSHVVGLSVLFGCDEAEAEHAGRLRTLLPHLHRAAAVNAALDGAAFQRHAAEAVLDRMEQPAAVLDADGRVLLCSRSAHPYLPAFRMPGAGGAALRRLVRATALGTGGDGGAEGGWAELPRPFLCPGGDADQPLEQALIPVLVAPLRAGADHRAGPFTALARCALVLVLDPAARRGMPDGELRRRFALTPAEARVAGLLGAGNPPARIAEKLGLRASTVRQYLKAVLGKTGTHSQAELLHLLRAG